MRVQFVDCRWELGEPARGRELYRAGHLPGASFLDVERDLSAPPGGPDGGRHPLPSPEAFERAAGAAGIGPGVLVAAYDQGMSGGAARLWWLLRHFGHDEVAVLAGGVRGWLGPLEEGEGSVQAAQFRARPGGGVAGADELLERLGDERLVLVDVRAPERYRGEVEPIDAVAGHIPGAVNVPFAEALAAELPRGEEVVVYCGSGVTACVGVLAYQRAGIRARLYAGSWSEWSSRGLPVEHG